MTITDLDRNDVPNAMKVYEAEVRAGTWNPDKAEALLMLQDDPTELMRRFQIVSRT